MNKNYKKGCAKTPLRAIYINKEIRKMLDDMQNKYKLSKSTIIATIFNWESIENEQCLIGRTLTPKTAEKMRIKPKQDEHNPNEFSDRTLTNAIYYYYQTTINPRQTKQERKILDKVHKELKDKKEQHWNYNNQLRSFTRMVRKNPKWFKGLYEQSKGIK